VFLEGYLVLDSWLTFIVLIGFFALLGLLVFLLVTRAFEEMGFSGWEAVVIVVASFLLGQGLLDEIIGLPFSGWPLFSVNGWVVAVNFGGAVVPVLVSVYLVVWRRLSVGRVVVGLGLVAVVTYLVTFVDPMRGIVAVFPWWLVPVVVASVSSVVLMRDRRVAAPFAYVVGVCGVLVGADVLHLGELLSMSVAGSGVAVIGGASVFDMVFTTGVLAVLLDSFFLVRKKRSGIARD
jgi:uncharacterized membrane protein